MVFIIFEMDILFKNISIDKINKKDFLNKENILLEIRNKDLSLRKTNNIFHKNFVYEKIFRLNPTYLVTYKGYYD